MSGGRKKDRFNETWTKDELTDSLRRVDRKSSHRRSDNSRARDETDKRNDRDSDTIKTRHSGKPRSRVDEETTKYSDNSDHKGRREDRSKRHDGYDEEDHRRKDRHRQHDDRKKSHRDRTELDSHERDRHRSKRDESGKDKVGSHTSNRKSSRHNEYRDDEDRRRNEYEDDSSHHRKKEKRRHREEDTLQEDKRTKDRHSKHDGGRRDKHKDGRVEEYSNDLREEKRQSKHDGRHDRKENREPLSGSSRHVGDNEYRRRRKEKSQREDNEENNGDNHRRRDGHGHDTRDRGKRRDGEKLREENEYDNERRRSKRREEKERYSEKSNHHRRDDSERHKRKDKYADRGSNHNNLDVETSRERNQGTREEYAENRVVNENSKTIPVNANRDENEYDYEDDDFEDYEDDFDDEGESENETFDNKPKKPLDEMDELMLALKTENKRANSAQSSSHFRSYAPSDDNETPYSQSSYPSHDQSRVSSGSSATAPVTMISFSVGSKSNSSKTRKRMLKRSTDLLSLIQLESVGFDILDMPPVNEYNLYIKNFGNSNTTQASVQCNEDNLEQDVQTDVPDVDSKWTQHPPQDLKCSGGEEAISNNKLVGNDRQNVLSTLRIDTLRVTKFMKRASKLIEAILNDDDMWRSSKNDVRQKSELSFCDSVTSLQTNLPYLQGRNIVHIASSQGSSHNVIAVAFQPASHSFSTRIDRKGLIAIWDTRKPAIPEKILVCDACPTYCCFGVGRSYILFTGTDDGCVLAYDLRESGVHHQIVSLDRKRETILRSATYSTGYLEDGHSSPIVSLTAIGADSNLIEDNQLMPRTLDRKSHSGLAFQLASLEESARLCIWIVVETLPEVDSNDDLGLAPHGRIKLIRTLSYTIPSPVKGIFPVVQFQSTCIQFSLIDPNNFYVGTDTGHIIHGTQYSVSNEQTSILNDNKDMLFNEIESISPVTSIDINPFQLFGASLILAGHDDGCVRLYLSDRQYPVISWPFSTNGCSIIKVQWSSIRPSVFFVLDGNHCLHVWDLAIMHAGPIRTELSNAKRMKNFALSKASVTKSPEIALIYEEATEKKSVLEVHKLAPHFSQITDYQELDQLTFLIQSLL